jgi:hypothetical protein
MGSIDSTANVVRSTGQPFTPSTLSGMGLDVNELLSNLGAVQKHCDEQKKLNDESVSAIADQKSQDSIGGILSGALTGAAKFLTLNSITDGASGGTLTAKANAGLNALLQQGINSKDNILKQISDIHPADLAAKAYADFDPNKSASEALGVAKNLLSMTIQQIGQDAVLVTVEGIAKKIIKEVHDRDPVLDRLEKNITLLYNQLYTVINGKDVIGPYLLALRQAYSIIILQESKFRSTRNILARTGTLNNRGYDSVIAELETAQNLLMPPGSKTHVYTFAEDAANSIFPSPLKDVLKANEVAKSLDRSASAILGDFTNNIKILAIDARVQAFTGMGVTMTSLASDVAEYAKRTLTINSLILQYLAVASQFDSLTSLKGFNQGLVDQMDAILSSMNVLINDMGSLLGSGSDTSLLKDKRTVVLRAGDWHVQLASILAHLQFIYRSPTQPTDKTKVVKNRYAVSVGLLNSYNTRTFGTATLTATKSKEEFISLSKSIIKVVGICTRALNTLTVDKNAEQYFKNVRDRIKLSRKLGVDIVNAVTPVAEGGDLLASSSRAAIENVKNLFRKLGFDRVVDLIDFGQFSQVYQSALQNATYAGQAIVGVNALIEGLKTCPTVGQEEITSLENVRSKFHDDELKKQLNSRRVASNNILAREADLTKQGTDIEAQCQRATSIVEKCVPSSQQSPDFSKLLSSATGGIFNIKI